MAKTRLDFAAAYRANKENNAVTEAKIATGVALAEAQTEEKKAQEAKPQKEKPAATQKSKPKAAPKKKTAEAAPKKKVGRPASKTAEGEETTLRSFYLTSREIAAIDLACAKDKSLSKTDVVRMALDAYFEKNGIYKAVDLLGL